MNYITSCPACETQFFLTKDHLKSYGGKVQCGNCDHIFNAKNRLTEVSDDIHSTAEYKASLENQAKQEDVALVDEKSIDEKLSDEKPIDEVLSNVLGGVPSLQNLETSSDITSDANEPYFDEINIEASAAINDAYNAEPIHAPIVIEDLANNTAFSSPIFDKPEFNKRKSKTSFWLLPVLLLLALLAGLQAAYANRTQLAAEYPQFKPYLQQACVALQCKIALPKNVDLITIDDSDMQEDDNHDDVIKFTSLIINNANYAQSYPDIELTLTSTDDQPVLRKLIKPAEYLSTTANVANGLAAREEVRVNLAINVKDLEVAGYRVLLVY